MADQAAFDFTVAKPSRRRQGFDKFHADHPEVYEELKRRALQVKDAGRRVGLRCLLESLRWSWAIGQSDRWWGTSGSERFKIDGNYQRHYRDLLNAEPGLRNFFPARERSAP